MQLLAVFLLLQLLFQCVFSLSDEKDHESAKLNVTLATIFQLLENNTNQVFPSDQHKEVFMNHFQYVLDSVLDKKQEDQLISNNLLDDHSSSGGTEDSLIEEAEEVSIPVGDTVQNGNIIDEDCRSVEEGREGQPQIVSSEPLTTPLINTDNATVWELFKLQVQQDFAPLLLLIPKPVKQRIAEELRQSSHRVKLILSGAFSPMLFSLSKLINNLGQSLQRIAQETEDFYSKNKPLASHSFSTTTGKQRTQTTHSNSQKNKSVTFRQGEEKGEEEEEVIEL